MKRRARILTAAQVEKRERVALQVGRAAGELQSGLRRHMEARKRAEYWAVQFVARHSISTDGPETAEAAQNLHEAAQECIQLQRRMHPTGPSQSVEKFIEDILKELK